MDNGLPFRDGATVNQYAVQRHLETGALGPVYQAMDTGVHRTVELRVVDEALDDAERAARVRRATERLTRLRHPHVLSLLNFGESAGTFYLVYDSVRGTSLAERIENDPPQADVAVRLVEWIGEAVDFIHDEGVVHGSLVPESIVLGPDGHAYVADAGVVPALSDDPERYTADRDRQYLAAIAYHLLTGSEPGSGRNLQAPSRLNPRLGPATDAVLLRGLSTGPRSGWPSCDAFVQELERALSQDARGVAAQRKKTSADGGRRRAWIIAGVLAAVVVIAVAAIAWVLTHQTTSPAVEVSSGAVNAGDSIVVMGRNLPKGQAGTIQIESSPRQIGVFQADPNGSFTKSVQVPKDMGGGGHVLSLCWNGSCPAQTALQVTATPTPSPSPTPTPQPTFTPIPTPVPTPVPTPRPTPTPVPPPTQPPPSSEPSG
jgi:serine/threonine protein kinase